MVAVEPLSSAQPGYQACTPANDGGEPRSAYIHVPFCAHRCGYCDFTLVADRDELIDGYLEALQIELGGLKEPRILDTLFLGGGTPTHLSAVQLAHLMELLSRWFRLAANYEFSVEANPSGLPDEKIAVLADAGVNRVSLGVQSFDSRMLSLLERAHRRKDVHAAINCVRRRIDNISVDLMFGVPGQTLELWCRTLAQAVALQPRHVSTYGLTFEKGTPFWMRRQKQQLIEPAEELQRRMYAAAIDELPAAGFEQYELSNFAQPGFRCRHNEVYWKGLPYYGFGPGAARYVDGRRETNHRSVTTWLKRVLKRLGLKGHLPTFRHAFISRALTSGVPEAVVRSWVGHVDRDVLKLYTHIADAESQSAMQRLTGRQDVSGNSKDKEHTDDQVKTDWESAQSQHTSPETKNEEDAN